MYRHTIRFTKVGKIGREYTYYILIIEQICRFFSEKSVILVQFIQLSLFTWQI
jgi:hypothetical protein